MDGGALFDGFSGLLRRGDLALAVGGGKGVGHGCCSGDVGGEGLEMGGLQREQDGGCFSLGVTEISIGQPCRMYFCAPKYARGSFKPTISMDGGALFDGFWGVLRGGDLALAVGGGKRVGHGCCSSDVGGEGLEMGGLRREQDGGCFSLGVTEISVEQPRRMYFCAPKKARGSFKPTISMDGGASFDGFWGVLKREGRSFV